MSFKVVKIQKADNLIICDLYEKAFGRPMCRFNSSELFSWFFFNNIYKDNYSRGFHNGSMLTAYWGCMPLDCKINHQILKGSLTFQLVSTEEYLGVTLFLWKEIEKDIINNTIAISYAFINENSYSLLKNLGWKVENNPILINIIHPFKLINDLISRNTKYKILKIIISKLILSIDYLFSKLMELFHTRYDNVQKVKCFDDNYNELWNIMSESMTNGVDLNIRYVNWRYIDKPNNTYKILSYMDNGKVIGYLIYDIKKEFGTHIGYIMDIIADPNNENVINSLIKFSKKQLFQDGVTMISALSFKENIFYSNLKSTGFFNVPKRFLPHKSYFTIYNFMELANDFNLNKWHISWGNHDNK